MTLDLSADAVVRMGSGLILLAVGLGVLLLARGAPRGSPARWLGVWAVAQGAFFVPRNLDRLDPWLMAIADVLVTCALAGLVGIIATVPGRARGSRAVLCAGALVATLPFAALAGGNGFQFAMVVPTGATALELVPFRLGILLYVVSVWLGSAAALVLCDAPGGEPRQLRGRALVALVLVAFLALSSGNMLRPAPGSGPMEEAGFVRLTIAAWVALVPALVAGLILIVRDRPSGLVLLWGVPALGLVGVIESSLPQVDLLVGIARSIVFASLAYAVLALDPFDLGLRSPTARRGASAAGALAALFVVAQIAQNFFEAQYGLLMGGLVAGALLVAARPIERALEGRSLPVASAAAAPSAEESRRRSYRTAVRYALRHGGVTRAEETHLSELAQHLGIGAGDAMRIRHEVEDEMREPAARETA